MSKEYTCKHYYWDDADREYTIEATWVHEINYPAEPDHEILTKLEVLDQDDNAPDIDHLLAENGNIWNKIERDGIDWDNATEQDYY